MISIYRIFKKIKKIIDYIPILWNDEDFDIVYLLRLISFKSARMLKYVVEHNVIVESEIEEQKFNISRFRDAINKYLDTDKYFPMEFYDDKFNSTIKIVPTGEVHNEYGELSKPIHVFKETGLEIPEGHEFYKYQKRYIKRIENYESAAWNRIWNTIKNNGYRWGD